MSGGDDLQDHLLPEDDDDDDDYEEDDEEEGEQMANMAVNIEVSSVCCVCCVCGVCGVWCGVVCVLSEREACVFLLADDVIKAYDVCLPRALFALLCVRHCVCV